MSAFPALRVRAAQDAEAAALAEWPIIGSDRKATEYPDSEAWLAGWRARGRHRDGGVLRRRAALERCSP